MANYTIESTFAVSVGTVTSSSIIVTSLAGADFVNDGTVDMYANSFRFNLTPTVTPATGQMYWDTDFETVSIELGGATLQIGQEMYTKAVNKTGVQINDGDLVYVTGAQGNRPTIALARADSYNTSILIGMATQDVPDNEEGFITTMGIVHNFNTSTFTAGDKLFLSDVTPGLVTNILPVAPDFLVFVGYALNSTANGSIFISPDIPISLDGTFAANSNLFSVSQKAIKTYVDANAGLVDDDSVTIAKAAPTFKTRVTANVATSYAIDRDAGSVFELTMTAGTTFTDCNLASGTDTEDISIILDGNFVPVFPLYWEATPSSDAYDGSVRNLLIVETVTSTDVIYSLENLST